MNSHVDEYVALRGKSRLQFWFELYREWWQRYPWRLPDDVEPPTDDLEKMAELASVKKDEEGKKYEVEEALRKVSFLAEFWQPEGS